MRQLANRALCLWDKKEGRSNTEKIKNDVRRALKETRKHS